MVEKIAFERKQTKAMQRRIVYAGHLELMERVAFSTLIMPWPWMSRSFTVTASAMFVVRWAISCEDDAPR